MTDIEQTIAGLEEQQGRKFTEQERKVLEGFGGLLNMMWNRQDSNESKKKNE